MLGTKYKTVASPWPECHFCSVCIGLAGIFTYATIQPTCGHRASSSIALRMSKPMSVDRHSSSHETTFPKKRMNRGNAVRIKRVGISHLALGSQRAFVAIPQAHDMPSMLLSCYRTAQKKAVKICLSNAICHPERTVIPPATGRPC